MLTDDDRACFDKLQAVAADLAMIQSRALYTEQAQALYTKIKNFLKEEHARTSNSRLEHTPAEEMWYRRAVLTARSHMRAPTNATPDKLASSAGQALLDVRMTLLRLEKIDHGDGFG